MKMDQDEIDAIGSIVKISSYFNLMFNMSGGLLPENLSKDEVEILKDKHGNDWFTELGYSEPKYKRPTF